MNHFRTVGARLSLALLLVVAAVLAFVYLLVVPSLENRLVDSRTDQVATVASRVADQLRIRSATSDLALRFASASNTRVTIFQITNRSPLLLNDIVDQGAGGVVGGIANDRVAEESARLLAPNRGVMARADRTYAEAAQP